MPSAPRSTLRKVSDLLTYSIAKTAGAVLSRLPPRAAAALARLSGRVLFHVLRRRQRIALRNLDIAFRSLRTLREKRRIARQAFEHAAACLAWLAGRERWVTKERISEFFEPAPAEFALLEGPQPRGLAVLSSHVGDWELLHHYLILRGLPMSVVVREISNPHLERELRRIRSRNGASVIPKEGALREIRAVLRRGGVVGMIADQNDPRRRRFFPFFGTPASTYTEYARVLARSGCRVVFVACIREGSGLRHRIEVRDITPAEDRDIASAEVRDITPVEVRDIAPAEDQDITSAEDPAPEAAEDPLEALKRKADAIVRSYLKATEDLVARHPEQYLWIHRRWKSRPTGAPWLYHRLGHPLDPGLLAVDNPDGEAAQ